MTTESEALDKILINLYLGESLLDEYPPDVIRKQMQSPELSNAKQAIQSLIAQ